MDCFISFLSLVHQKMTNFASQEQLDFLLSEGVAHDNLLLMTRKKIIGLNLIIFT